MRRYRCGGGASKTVRTWGVAFLFEDGRIETFLVQTQRLHCVGKIAKKASRGLSTRIRINSPARTLVLLHIHHQTLLWMICDVRCHHGKDSANASIGTHHVYSLPSCITQQLYNLSHAVVEEPIATKASICICEAFQLRDWYVSDQHRCAR